MFRILLSSLAFVFASTPALAAATQDGFYVELNTGLTSASDVTDSDLIGGGPTMEFDGGANFGGAIGYRFLHHYRGELNISNRKNDVDKVDDTAATGDINATSFMANIYYDFDLESSLKPYLGAGFGTAMVDLNAVTDSGKGSTSIDQTDSAAFAWSLMAGASYPVHENVDLSLGYRYLGAFFDLDNADFHELLIGVRYSF